ncbi:Rrf2 family protein [Sphingomonas sp. BK235]|nr:Rrf2 family protein [Sphingomonas sp. BK235]
MDEGSAHLESSTDVDAAGRGIGASLYGVAVEYALHCLLWLVKERPHRASSRELAELQGVPAAMLAKVMPKLERAQIVSSRGGISGGYALERSAADISVLDVVNAVEGDRRLQGGPARLRPLQRNAPAVVDRRHMYNPRRHAARGKADAGRARPHDSSRSDSRSPPTGGVRSGGFCLVPAAKERARSGPACRGEGAKAHAIRGVTGAGPSPIVARRRKLETSDGRSSARVVPAKAVWIRSRRPRRQCHGPYSARGCTGCSPPDHDRRSSSTPHARAHRAVRHVAASCVRGVAIACSVGDLAGDVPSRRAVKSDGPRGRALTWTIRPDLLSRRVQDG